MYLPTRESLVLQDRCDLYGAMQSFGGAKKLALHMDVKIRKRSRRSFRAVAEDLYGLMQTRFRTTVRLPTPAELKAVGRASLIKEIERFGGFKYFASKIGWVYRAEGKSQVYAPTAAVNPYLAYSLFQWELQFWTDSGVAQSGIDIE